MPPLSRKKDMSWACSTLYNFIFFLTHYVFAANPAAVTDVKADERRENMSK